MNLTGQRLLDLLPALYRLRDAEIAAAQGTPSQPGPLEALLTLVAEQLSIVSDDLDQLYEDQFIETCAPWVIPYIGDLIGYQTVNGVAPAVASPRAEVAHTISFRRRKGTVLALEQLARDVTGWGAHAVEFFQLLTGTQYMNHIRSTSGGNPDLRQWQTSEYISSGFDALAHNVDVRAVSSGAPRHNIQNIGVFLWSLNPYSQTAVQAVPVTGQPSCFRLSTLGADMPLFTHPVSQGTRIMAGAQPVNLPLRLRRRVLCQDLQAGASSVYYGAGKSLQLTVSGLVLNASQITVCNLSGPDGHWWNVLPHTSPFVAAIDPELGRISVRAAAAGAVPYTVQASFWSGFNADMGGGEYPRSATFTVAPQQAIVKVPGDHPTIHDAITALKGQGIVEVSNSGTYAEPTGLTIAVNANESVILRAADGARPTLVLGAAITVTGAALSSFEINGLLLTCPPIAAESPVPPALLHVPAATNTLAQLTITHCTFVPGWSLTGDGSPVAPTEPALLVELPALAVSVSKSILGALRVHPRATTSLADSVIDATALTNVAYSAPDGAAAGAALTCTGCTVIGKVHATLFSLVSNTIVLANLIPADTWAAALWSDRRQQGCIRFSYLPAATISPQPYECASQKIGSPEPRFFTLRYGAPEYAKLLSSTGDAIRRGAEDGGEMGAFHFVLAPLRESDLRVRLNEYLAVGMDCGLIYAT